MPLAELRTASCDVRVDDLVVGGKASASEGSFTWPVLQFLELGSVTVTSARRAATQVGNCSAAHADVLRQCPSCAGCRMQDLSCYSHGKPEEAKAEGNAAKQPSHRAAKQPKEKPKQRKEKAMDVVKAEVFHSAEALCEKPAKAGFMWKLHGDVWKQLACKLPPPGDLLLDVGCRPRMRLVSTQA